MKKITFLLSSMAFCIITSCGPSQKDAVSYNDKLMAVLNNLNPAQSLFLDQIDGHNGDSLIIVQKLFSQKSKTSVEEVSKFTPFADNNDYLNAASNYFKTINHLADFEANEMTEIMTKDSSLISDNDIIRIQVLAVRFDSTYDKAYDLITEAQATFAKKWKFEIEKVN